MKKTEKLSMVANAVLAMTYREVQELASECEFSPDDILDWAERYMAPAEVPSQ